MTGVAVGNEVLARPGAGAARDGRVYVRESTANFLAVLASSYPPAARSTRRPRSRLAISLSGEARAGGGDEVQYEPAAPTVYGRLPRPEHGRAVRQGSGDGVPRGLGRRARRVLRPFQRLDGPRPPAFPSAMALARNPAPARAHLHDKDEDD